MRPLIGALTLVYPKSSSDRSRSASEGGDVNAGDLLYVIEQAPYQAKVDVDKARVAQAKATLTKARQYLHRVRAVSSGIVSATDIDNAVADELQGKADVSRRTNSTEYTVWA